MLVESFVASTRKSELSKTSTALKDVGIHINEFQPLPALKASFKKSSTQKNCLAITTTHLFAAQADKSVVHVYNIDRGNQEAIVPFPEKITSLALAGEHDGAAVLILGTEVGRLILWEVSFICGSIMCRTNPLTIRSSSQLVVKSRLPNLTCRP